MFSCSVEKRYHRGGWNVQYRSIITPLKLKKSSPVFHAFSDNKTIPNKELSTSSSKKFDTTQLSIIVFEKNDKVSSHLIVAKDTLDSLTPFKLQKRMKMNFKGNFRSKESETSLNFRKDYIYHNGSANVQHPNYFEDSTSLWESAVIVLIFGLIFLLISVFVKSVILVLIAEIILFIAGILFFMALLSAFLCIITLGMIC